MTIRVESILVMLEKDCSLPYPSHRPVVFLPRIDRPFCLSADRRRYSCLALGAPLLGLGLGPY